MPHRTLAFEFEKFENLKTFFIQCGLCTLKFRLCILYEI